MISILVPLYNGLKFLDENIKSVISQTYTDWELLIGINGHNNFIASLIGYKINLYGDSRIKHTIFDFKNKSRTLNTLITIASSDYVCLLDVDDCWMPIKLESQLQFINKYDVVGTNGEYFGDRIGSPNIFLGELSPEMFSYQNPIINSSVMFKKKDGYWDESWEGIDDYNLWIDLLNKQKTFYNIPTVLTMHRIHSDSFYNNENNKYAKKLKEEKIKQLTDEDYKKLYNIMDNKKWKL